MKRFLFPVLAAVAGCGLLALLFPRVHPAATWGYVFGRQEAIERARVFASSQAVQTQGWTAFVTGEFRNRLARYQELYPEDAAARKISPVLSRVTFVSPDKSHAFACELYPDGRIAGWDARKPVSDPLAPYAPMQDARSAAEKALLVIAGTDAAGYRLSTIGAGTKTGSRFTWERIRPGPALQPTIDIIVHRGQVVHAETHLDFDKPFESRFFAERQSTEWMLIGYYILYFVIVIAAAIFYTLGSIQHRVSHRFAFIFSFVNLAFIIAAFFTGPSPDKFRANEALEGITAVVQFTGFAMAIVSGASLAWVVAGAGLFVAGAMREKWWSLRLLLSRKLISRPVGVSITAGVLWAPLLTAVPFLIAAIFPHPGWHHREAGELLSRSPLLQALNYPLHPSIVGFLGILLAFVIPRVRIRSLRLLTLTLIGVVFLLGFENQFESSAGASLVNAALMFAALFELYRRFDLLAVLIAESVRIMLYIAPVLLLQPSVALHAVAWRMLAFTGLLLGAGLVLLLKAKDLRFAEASKDHAIAAGIRSAREDLKSEFSVAQRAQREMLPLKPPLIPGFSLAAHCTPAKDVGGDLYDFLPLANDRMAIAVADVSGKGVPAALYMTLTKGLLVATTEDNLSLSRMLEQINTHLYAVGRRKTFVTMALGILDPRTKTLDYARAGHNPVVWRSPSSDSTRLLDSPGLGLGITGGPVFGRKLAIERLDLCSGDTLVFYSDGLTEAMNPELEEFGEERLLQAVERLDALPAAEARDSILATVTTFLAGNHPQDDLTLVVLRVE